jgi:hypothetical protein
LPEPFVSRDKGVLGLPSLRTPWRWWAANDLFKDDKQHLSDFEIILITRMMEGDQNRVR